MYEKTKSKNYPANDWIVLHHGQLTRLKKLFSHWILVDIVGAIIMWIPLLIANNLINSGYIYRIEASHMTMTSLALQGLVLGLVGAGLQILAILVMKGCIKRLYCKILVVMWGLIGAVHYAGFMMPQPEGVNFWNSSYTPGIPYGQFWLNFQTYVLSAYPILNVFGAALIITLVIRIKSARAK